jgi:hypothetical protein
MPFYHTRTLTSPAWALVLSFSNQAMTPHPPKQLTITGQVKASLLWQKALLQSSTQFALALAALAATKFGSTRISVKDFPEIMPSQMPALRIVAMP